MRVAADLRVFGSLFQFHIWSIKTELNLSTVSLWPWGQKADLSLMTWGVWRVHNVAANHKCILAQNHSVLSILKEASVQKRKDTKCKMWWLEMLRRDRWSKCSCSFLLPSVRFRGMRWQIGHTSSKDGNDVPTLCTCTSEKQQQLKNRGQRTQSLWF